MSRGKIHTKDLINNAEELSKQAYKEIDQLIDEMGRDDGSNPEFYLTRVGMRYGLLAGISNLLMILRDVDNTAFLDKEKEQIATLSERRRLAYKRFTEIEDYMMEYLKRIKRSNNEGTAGN